MKIPVLFAPALPSSLTPTQLPSAVKPAAPLITLIPVSAPVTERPVIVTPSLSTVMPKLPTGALTPTQGPSTPASVMQVPPMTLSCTSIGGRGVASAIVSTSWPWNTAASKSMMLVDPMEFVTSIAAGRVHLPAAVSTGEGLLPHRVRRRCC